MLFIIIEIILIWNKISKFRLIKTYKGINLKIKEEKKSYENYFIVFFFFVRKREFLFFFLKIYIDFKTNILIFFFF
jgi:hypothetical protein